MLSFLFDSVRWYYLVNGGVFIAKQSYHDTHINERDVLSDATRIQFRQNYSQFVYNKGARLKLKIVLMMQGDSISN